MQASRNFTEWKELIEEQNKSGLNKTKFCQQKGINASRFFYYQNLIRKIEQGLQPENLTSKAAPFLPVQIKGPKMETPEKETSIRFILKTGLECILPSAIDNKRMKEIIEVLVSC